MGQRKRAVNMPQAKAAKSNNQSLTLENLDVFLKNKTIPIGRIVNIIKNRSDIVSIFILLIEFIFA